MNSNRICEICERDIDTPSPQADQDRRHLQALGLIDQDGTPSPELEDNLRCLGQETSVVPSGETTVHEQCQSVKDRLKRLGTEPELVEKRLEGYKAGLPSEAYMNGFRTRAPSTNSYRVLAAAWWATKDIRTLWESGNILPGECFQPEMDLGSREAVLLVQDLDLQESSVARSYAHIAQMALSYAIVIWCAAHKSKYDRGDDQEMFLEYKMYDDSRQPDVKRFTKIRNKAISHVTTGSWDDLNIHHSYMPYPGWAVDWQPFEKLLRHSIYLCKKDIAERQGDPEPDPKYVYPDLRPDGSSDPIMPGVDLMNALGIPAKRGTGSRPPLQGPYPFEYDGARWVEVAK